MNKNQLHKKLPLILILILTIVFTSSASLTAFAAYDSKDPEATAMHYLEENEPGGSSFTLSEKYPAIIMGDLNKINLFEIKYSPGLDSFPGTEGAVYYVKLKDRTVSALLMRKDIGGHWSVIQSYDANELLQSADTLKAVVPDKPIAYFIQGPNLCSSISVIPYTDEMTNGYIYEDGKVYKTRDFLQGAYNYIQNLNKMIEEGTLPLMGGSPPILFAKDCTPVKSRDFIYENQFNILIGAVVIIIAAVVGAVILIKKKAVKNKQ